MRGILLHAALAVLFATLAMLLYRGAITSFEKRAYLGGIVSAICAFAFSGVTVYCIYIIYVEVLRRVH